MARFEILKKTPKKTSSYWAEKTFFEEKQSEDPEVIFTNKQYPLAG